MGFVCPVDDDRQRSKRREADLAVRKQKEEKRLIAEFGKRWPVIQSAELSRTLKSRAATIADLPSILALKVSTWNLQILSRGHGQNYNTCHLTVPCESNLSLRVKSNACMVQNLGTIPGAIKVARQHLTMSQYIQYAPAEMFLSVAFRELYWPEHLETPFGDPQ